MFQSAVGGRTYRRPPASTSCPGLTGGYLRASNVHSAPPRKALIPTRAGPRTVLVLAVAARLAG